MPPSCLHLSGDSDVGDGAPHLNCSGSESNSSTAQQSRRSIASPTTTSQKSSSCNNSLRAQKLAMTSSCYIRSPEYYLHSHECRSSSVAAGTVEVSAASDHGGETSATTVSCSSKESMRSFEEVSSSDGGVAVSWEVESRGAVVEAGESAWCGRGGGEAGESAWCSSSRRRERSSSSNGGMNEEEGEENEGCYTPRAKESRIQQLRFCPPAPRKRKPCLRLPTSLISSGPRQQLSGFFVVPDFEAFFPLHQIPLRD